MTTLRLFGHALGSESMLVRCNLSRAESPVEVDYGTADGWEPTRYRASDCRHRVSGLLNVGRELAAAAVELPAAEFDCECEEVQCPVN